MTTKIHTLVDANGNPLNFILSGGNRHDMVYAVALFEGFSQECRLAIQAILGDKGYDCDRFVAFIENHLQAEAVIPSRNNRTEIRLHDKDLYKDRHKVENYFSRIKHYRRVATRYDKKSCHYKAFLYLTGIMQWLR